MKKIETVVNQHLREFRCGFTLEYNVKRPFLPEDISEKVMEYEMETSVFTNLYAQECYDKISEKIGERQTWKIVDWAFAGRSGGWFCLLCIGKQEALSKGVLKKIEQIVLNYFNNYGKKLLEFYRGRELGNV